MKFSIKDFRNTEIKTPSQYQWLHLSEILIYFEKISTLFYEINGKFVMENVITFTIVNYIQIFEVFDRIDFQY